MPLVQVVNYYMRAFDSGTNVWVYWLTTTPLVTPTTTSPQYTGTLSSTQVVYNYKTMVNVTPGYGGMVFAKYVSPTSGSIASGNIGAGWVYYGNRSAIINCIKPSRYPVTSFRPANVVSDCLIFTGTAVRVS